MIKDILHAALLFSCTSLAETISFSSPGNPILGDGSIYSADPGPLVHNGTLYVISGQDEAAVGENSFIINNWLLFETTDPNPSGSSWTVKKDFIKPNEVFSWATEGAAYASQIVVGPDGRFYLFAPVMQRSTAAQDGFAIGVAVADSISGPYEDSRPAGPIVSQTYPAPGNDIHNIDPTVLVDGDEVYMYWGSFGRLKGVKLQPDMVTFDSDVVDVNTLDGFFEAPWIMKRGSTYYMLYAANNAGPDSPCTPTAYHACLAYGTSDSPLGPWQFQDVILGIVSSTTSHPGAVQFGDEWYLVYHTADAVDGGHFRRSIAYDVLNFDDTSNPPRILPVQQTLRPQAPAEPTYDRGQYAVVTTDPENSVVYWTKALNDLKIPVNPLPPQYWSSYNGPQNSLTSTLTYEWNKTVTLNSTSMVFFADQPAGSVIGVTPPESWRVEYLTASGSWVPVENSTSYPLEVTNSPESVEFEEISTTSVRALLVAPSDGDSTAGVGVIEWSVKSPDLSSSF